MTEPYSDDFLAGAQHVTNRLTRYLSDDESDWWRGYRAGRYDAIDIYSGAVNDAANAIDSYLINDYAGMDASTRNINTAADDLGPVLTDYYTTSDECLGGGLNG